MRSAVDIADIEERIEAEIEGRQGPLPGRGMKEYPGVTLGDRHDLVGGEVDDLGVGVGETAGRIACAARPTGVE